MSIKEIAKKINKFLLALLLGILAASSSVYAATVISGKDVGYIDNTSLGVDNVQDAIDEIYKKSDIRNYNNIVSAYTYNSSTCVTGEEDACVKTDCYKSMEANSCKAGDIIKYKVNDTDIVTFHVMYDNSSTLTM